MGELLAKLEELVQKTPPSTPIDHPQVVGNTLYVTPAQYTELRRAGASLMEQWTAKPLATLDVVVLKSGEQVARPDGKVLLYSSITKELYVMDPKKMQL